MLALAGALAVQPIAWAQGVPAPPAAPPLPIPGAPPAPIAVVQPNNIWSRLCPTMDQWQALKQCYCATPFGKITAAMGQPVGFMTGGLFGNCCPINGLNPDDLKKDPNSGEGAAALVKQDEAGAKARRAAMRYLGTVDCRYWPEAEAALINGLRADKIECVRWEAAMALQRGCCCTTKIILALTICVSGADNDGNPAECSPRVRDNAAIALAMCTHAAPPPDVFMEPPTVVPTPDDQKIPKDKLPKDKIPNGAQAADRKAQELRRTQAIETARRVLEHYNQQPAGQMSPGAMVLASRPGANGLLGLMASGDVSPAPSVGTESNPIGIVPLAYNWMRGNAVASSGTGPRVALGFVDSLVTVQPSTVVAVQPSTVQRSTVQPSTVQPSTVHQPSPYAVHFGNAVPAPPPVSQSTGPRVTTGTIDWGH
jgi:hypothetical protein